MVSTVVTSTVTTISTITTVTSTTTMIGFGMALGLVAVIALIAFLCVRELAGAGQGIAQRSLSGFLDVPVVPLTIAFAIIVVMQIVDILA